MKKAIFSFLIISSLFTTLSAQNDFLGEWKMVEFTQEARSEKEVYPREQIESDGVYWKIHFQQDSTYTLTTNFNKTLKTESFGGSWKLMPDRRLIMYITKDGTKRPAEYKWEFLSPQLLLLERQDPMGVVRLKIKFEKAPAGK